MYHNSTQYECGFISVNLKSMIYFYFTCLYEHNINILYVRVSVAMPNNELSSKKIPVVVDEKFEIYVLCVGWKTVEIWGFQTLFIEFEFVCQIY